MLQIVFLSQDRFSRNRWIPAGALPSSGDVTLTRRKHAPIGPAGQGFAMNESRHWMSALVATGFVGITLQGHADDGGKPRGEPPQDGSISKTVLLRRSGRRKPAETHSLAGTRGGLSRRGNRFLLRQRCKRTGPAGRLAARCAEPANCGMVQILGFSGNSTDRPHASRDRPAFCGF